MLIENSFDLLLFRFTFPKSWKKSRISKVQQLNDEYCAISIDYLPMIMIQGWEKGKPKRGFMLVQTFGQISQTKIFAGKINLSDKIFC